MKLMPYHLINLSRSGKELLDIYSYFENNDTTVCDEYRLNKLESIAFEIQYAVNKIRQEKERSNIK